jgi:hypothetical protein
MMWTCEGCKIQGEYETTNTNMCANKAIRIRPVDREGLAYEVENDGTPCPPVEYNFGCLMGGGLMEMCSSCAAGQLEGNFSLDKRGCLHCKVRTSAAPAPESSA